MAWETVCPHEALLMCIVWSLTTLTNITNDGWCTHRGFPALLPWVLSHPLPDHALSPEGLTPRTAARVQQRACAQVSDTTVQSCRCPLRFWPWGLSPWSRPCADMSLPLAVVQYLCCTQLRF